MRRESSTVVVLVGEVGDGLLAGLARYANVSVTRAPAADAEQASQATAVRPGWEPGRWLCGKRSGGLRRM